MSEGNGKFTGKQRRINDRSLANLRPFPKGVSGNPSGRPQGPTLLTEIRDLLNGRGGKDRKAAAKAFIAQLKRGSIAHAKEVIEREEGKTPDDGKLVVEFVMREAPPLEDDPSPN